MDGFPVVLVASERDLHAHRDGLVYLENEANWFKNWFNFCKKNKL